MKNEYMYRKARGWTVAGGLFNCVLAFPLSLPFLHEWYIGLLNRVNSFFNLCGKDWIAPVDGASMLFLNTSGLALTLVGMSLMYASRDIRNRIGIPLLNGGVRFIWAMIAVYYIVVYDLLGFLYFIVLADVLFAAVYLYFYIKIKSEAVVQRA